ncbi:MAG: hypothetical protein R2764_17140 [Bacteroidales bacterium]
MDINDLAEGEVMLYLESFAVGPCMESMMDSIMISIQMLPEADAGLNKQFAKVKIIIFLMRQHHFIRAFYGQVKVMEILMILL